jgi:GH18 family chitinase
MKRLILKFIFILLLAVFSKKANAQNLPCKEVIGYYPNWQWYDRAKLVQPNTIDYSKYTIINYAFFKPETNGNISSTDTWADDNLLNGQPNWAQGGYYPNTSIISLAHNAGVKVVPSIGGWTLSDNFPQIAADATKRTTFANACVQLISQYNFDGIDLDWEYPGYVDHNGTAADKQNFTLLLQAVRSALNAKTLQTGKTYLLTSCFGASQTHMNNIDWANVTPLLDCINLMSYDFFGAWDSKTNHNSPLYAPAQGDPTFNINSAVTTLLTTHNVPANKICVGLAFYGRSTKTSGTPTLHGNTTGSGDNVTFSDDDGTPLFYNVLKKQNLFNKYVDNLAASPYMLGKNGLNTFLSYDDTASITTKATYIKNKNLKGCIIWEITGDYIETSAGSGVIAGTPLATAIKNAFCGNSGGGNTTCTTPTNIIVTPTTSTANVSWSNTGATSYEVQYKLASSSAWTTFTSTNNWSDISSLTANAAYQIQVKSICSATLSSAFSAISNFSTTTNSGNGGGGTSSSPCTAPATFNFTSANYVPMGEIKIGQGRLNPIWGVSVDAYIPSNRKSWAISMAHAAHLFRNVVKTDKIPANFYFATAAKESFCGCDNAIQAAPSGTPFPFTYQAASLGDGCFQIENNSAYNEMVQQYPQRFPVGQHANLIGNANFETSALSKAYYDIFTVKYWEVHKNWNPIAFFNNAADPNAAIKLMAVAYNRGLWYTELETVLKTNRSTAITSNNISPYFINNNYGYDYQNALSNYTNILGNNTASVDPTLFNTNPATGQPYNSFNSFYDPQVTWSDVDAYIEKIKVLYPTVNFTTLKSSVQTVFNGINNGNAISFRYKMGQVLDVLMLGLPADDPSANIATAYGCGWQVTNNLPPVINIVKPINNQLFNTVTNIEFSVSTSDPDGTISKVEFYDGATLLSTITSAPYTYNWQNAAIGTHSLTAKAYDNLNAVTTSSAVLISVMQPMNQLPIVSIIQPTANQTYYAPANISITATASDPDGTISKVEFYNGNTLLFTDNIAPYSFNWQNIAIGNYQITAKAYDNLNVSKNSNQININVFSSAPTCIIASPSDKSIFYQPNDITINVKASAISANTITYVNFYSNGTLLGTVNKAPYSFVWKKAPIGTWNLTATAFTINNISTTSAPISVSIFAQGGNIPPSCNITQPINNQTFISPTNITLAANATDVNGYVTKVEFYNGATFLGGDDTAPYSFIWQNVSVGTYNITAKATDNQGASTVSSIVKIIVNANKPPTCNITQPIQNQNFTSPANISINVAATDSDGSITKVDFYQGATLLGTDNTSPYSLVWQNVNAGTYNLTAKATDNKGAITTSAVVTITVVNNTNSCSQYSSYVSGTTYQNGSIVTNNGGVYKCLIPGWCSGPAWAYSPGLGTAWQDAWTKTGTCTQVLPNCTTVADYTANAAYQTGSVVKNNANLYVCNIPSWCSGSASFYAPGVGSAWQQAWSLMGACPSNSSKIIFTKPVFDDLAYLYPNPTSENVTVFIPNTPVGQIQLHVFDVNGKNILTKNSYNEWNIYEEKLDLKDLPSGIYTIQIGTSQWIKTLLLSKQ